MPEKPDAPVVSGEILTDERKNPPRSDDLGLDVVEAEYETIVARHEKMGSGGPAKSDEREPEAGLGILRGNEQGRSSARGGPAFWLLGALLIIGGFWIAGGHALFSTRLDSLIQRKMSIPQALEIVDISSRIVTRNGHDILLVDGKVANKTANVVVLPDLIIRVTANDGTNARYRIASDGRTLITNSEYIFSTRLDAPDAGVKNVRVMIRDGNLR